MMFNYWDWFFRGEKSGIRSFCNIWLYAHLFIATALYIMVPCDLSDAAEKFLLPLASIFIGLAFAWAGNAQALLQAPEIENMADHHFDGIKIYVYTFQTAILVILITVVLWGLAAVEVFDSNFFILKCFFGVFLYFFASLSVRECWHVVLSSQYLLLARRQIKKISNNQAS